MKIFCIGMPRTGTMSLIEAARSLGFRAAHFNESYRLDRLGALSVENNRFVFEPGYDAYQFYADFPFPFPVIWRGLYRHYPESKFIYLSRDIDGWIESNKRLSSMPLDSGYHKTHRLYRLKMFGHGRCLDENDNAFRWAYEKHAAEVDKFFGDYDPRMLRWNLVSNPRWQPLCEFLKLPEPASIFPHRNDSKRYKYRRR